MSPISTATTLITPNQMKSMPKPLATGRTIGSMISIKDLLNIICTEAVEHGGVQEVPDNKHGARAHYHSQKRPARETGPLAEQGSTDELPSIKLNLEFVELDDGTFEWVEGD